MGNIHPPLSAYEVGNYARSAKEYIPNINMKCHGVITNVDGGIHFLNLFSGREHPGNHPLEPIPLVRDVLIYAGFKQTSDRHFKLNNYMLAFKTNRLDDAILYNCEEENGDAYMVNHVHELQNAFYTLTGTKLEKFLHFST